MNQDAITMGLLLRTLSRRQRSAIIRTIRRNSGAYSISWRGEYRPRSMEGESGTSVRELEELLVPTVLAGRVPVNEQPFVRSMRQLDRSPEYILGMLARILPYGAEGIWWRERLRWFFGIVIVLFMAAIALVLSQR